MKNLFTSTCIGFLSLIMIATSCSDDAIGDNFAAEQYSPRGALLKAENVETGFFDQLSPSTSSIAFDLNADGETVTTADVLVAYNGGDAVLFESVSSLPATINVPFTSALSALGIAESSVAVGDAVTFTFDATTSSGKYRSSTSLSVPVSCFSDLGGTYDYVSSNLKASGDGAGACPTETVSGQVTFTDLGGGKYLASDLGFGQYGSSCWEDGPATSANATFSDVCNELKTGGQDQYGLVYTWTITAISGADLSISWANDFGDSGEVVISRPDGSPWPSLVTQ